MAQIDVYDLTVTQFVNELTALKGILNKASAHADHRKFDVNTLFTARLAPDMFPLSRQIQICTDTAKFCVARLTSLEVPPIADTEQTIGEFLGRIDRVIEVLKTAKPKDFEGYDQKKITNPRKEGKFLTAHDYVIQHLLPNFYFHLAATYAILRHNGVEIGKNDYLGNVNWQNL